MPIIGSAPNKSFQRTDGTRTGAEVWQEAKAAAVKIRADSHDTHDEDIGDAISACLFKDGSNFSADMDAQTQKFTNVGVGTARNHFAALSQVQDSTALYAGTSAGTDTITATLSPAITAYVAGQRYHFKAGGTNTGAATVNFNSVGAKDIKKGAAGSTALGAGDITSGGSYSIIYDGTNFILENPGLAANVSAFMATVLDDADAATARATLGLGSISTQAASAVAITGGTVTGITDLAIADGGTGASTAATARTALAVGGAAVQRAYVETSSFTTSNIIPADGTVPQITEGGEVLSQAITPTSATNRIRVTFGGSFNLGTQGAGNGIAVALFNGAASAVAVAGQAYADNGHELYVGLVYEQVAGTTSAITFSVRGGATTGDQRLSTRYGTTIPRAAMVVEEINV